MVDLELKEKVEEIRRIKANRYLGTKDALNLIRLKEELEDRPTKISDLINKELGYAKYKATPEGIAYIDRMEKEFGGSLRSSNSFIPTENLEKNIREVFQALGLGLCSVFVEYEERTGFIRKEIDKNIVKRLIDYYKKANEIGVDTEEKFKQFVVDQYILPLFEGRVKPVYIDFFKSNPNIVIAKGENLSLSYRKEKSLNNYLIKKKIEEKIPKRILNDLVGREKKHGRELIDITLEDHLELFSIKSMFGDERVIDSKVIYEYIINEDPEEVYNSIIWELNSRITGCSSVLAESKIPQSADKKNFLKEVNQNLQKLRLIREAYGREKRYVILKIKNFMPRNE